jgi:hypothetical protein
VWNSLFKFCGQPFLTTFANLLLFIALEVVCAVAVDVVVVALTAVAGVVVAKAANLAHLINR